MPSVKLPLSAYVTHTSQVHIQLWRLPLCHKGHKAGNAQMQQIGNWYVASIGLLTLPAESNIKNQGKHYIREQLNEVTLYLPLFLHPLHWGLYFCTCQSSCYSQKDSRWIWVNAARYAEWALTWGKEETPWHSSQMHTPLATGTFESAATVW